MARKIFISYKYKDTLVQSLNNTFGLGLASLLDPTKVRDYVDELQQLLEENDEMNKGERDGEDLSDFSDSTIASRLRDKIYDSSITIVLISKGMKDPYKPEADQWIPWEISYSLKEHARNGRTSQTNAMLAVVLPDENGSYEYFIEEHSCPYCDSVTYKTEVLFDVLGKNMFNIKSPSFNGCSHHPEDNKVFTGYHSYIHVGKWSDFKSNVAYSLNVASNINDNIDDYNIVKVV